MDLDQLALPNVIMQHIIDEIVQGKIKSGDKLVEAKYSELFGTSRSPVREAFYLLTMEGYVTKNPRKGTIVKGFTSNEVRDILEIRNFLEQLSIDRMKENQRSACLLEMNKILLIMEEETQREAYTKLNYAFHQQLIIASGSDVIQQAYSRLSSLLLSLQSMSFAQEEAMKNSLTDHRLLISLLQDNRLDEAKELLHQHNYAVFSRIHCFE